MSYPPFEIPLENLISFKKKLVFYAAGFEVYSLLLSNNYDDEIEEGRPLYNKYELVAGLGAKRILSINSGNAFEELSGFHKEKPSWLFGYMGYDLKNETEKILSENEDRIGLDDMFFFEPEVLILVQGNKIQITSEVHNPEMVWEEITNAEIKESPKQSIELIPKISQEKYLEVVEKLRQHIIEGDIYEINFCQEFFAEDVSIDAEDLFLKLIEVSPNPFSALLKTKAAYIISSSMERFMKKVESKLISQPIKGTIKRTGNKEEDAALQHQLFNDEKERAENVMIVDLVRNDLAKSCKTGSVKVEELFGIYPFSQVFQMISTVVGELREEINWVDAIRNAFPMGSMTGAPKLRAMQLIEDYEETKRGVFSGAIGYITPDADFDFNVVIRTFIYHPQKQYLSVQVGSAITYDSIPEKEYEECLVKISGMKKVLV